MKKLKAMIGAIVDSVYLFLWLFLIIVATQVVATHYGEWVKAAALGALVVVVVIIKYRDRLNP